MVDLTPEHMGLVKKVMGRSFATFYGSDVWDDLCGAGMLGLVKAAHDWDASRGTAFASYAWVRIRGQIRDELRSRDHLSRHERKKVRAGLADDPGCACYLDMTEYARTAADPHDEFAAILDMDAVESTVVQLPPREFYAVWQHDIEGETLASIGSVLDVSESRVSQLRTAGHGKLRAMLAPAVLDAA